MQSAVANENPWESFESDWKQPLYVTPATSAPSTPPFNVISEPPSPPYEAFESPEQCATPTEAKPRVGTEQVEGISVCEKVTDDGIRTCVAWQIANLGKKTAASLGKPIVSPAFAIKG